MADQQQDREQDREGGEPAALDGLDPVDGASDGDGDDSGKGGQDEVKDRFQEALARKRAQHADVGNGGAGAASKIRGARGPASSQRSFRRKSGG